MRGRLSVAGSYPRRLQEEARQRERHQEEAAVAAAHLKVGLGRGPVVILPPPYLVHMEYPYRERIGYDQENNCLLLGWRVTLRLRRVQAEQQQARAAAEEQQGQLDVAERRQVRAIIIVAL